MTQLEVLRLRLRMTGYFFIKAAFLMCENQMKIAPFFMLLTYVLSS